MNELIERNESLMKALTASETQRQLLKERNESLMKTQSELEKQNQQVVGQLEDVKSYQRGLTEQAEEAKERNKSLMKTQSELKQQVNGFISAQEELEKTHQSLRASIKALQSEKNQPLALSTTNTNEPFLSEKDELIERLEKQIERLTDRGSEMFKELTMLRMRLRR